MEEKRTVGDVIQNEQIQNLKQKIEEADGNAREGRELHINRVPHQAHDDFKDLSEAKYCKDYGMTIAGLLQYYNLNERKNKELERVHERLDRQETLINNLQNQIDGLKNTDEQEEESKVKALNE